MPVSHPANMARGWRGLLEEESEHQWVAISGFFVFIILGAIAIQGTSSLPGVDYRSNGLEAVDGRVMDIVYGDSGSYTAMVLADEGGVIFHYDEQGEVMDIGADYEDVLGMTFMTQLHDGSIVVSPSNNTLEVIPVKSETLQPTTIPLNENEASFDILDVAEQSNGDGYHWLMVTDEGSNSSLRGFGDIATPLQPVSIAVWGATVTSAMMNNDGYEWNMVEALDEGTWVATGLMANSFGSDEISPATPIKHPVIGLISWSSAATAPMLTYIEEIDRGEIHSLIKLENGSILAAGSDSSVHIALDGTMTEIDVASESAALDEKGAVWFFAGQGSTSVVRMTDGATEKMPLARPLPLNVEVSGVSNGVIYAHGMDNEGEPGTYSIDTLAIGSIESGRGFLNFIFFTVSSIVMGVMLWTAFSRMRQNQ